jgi:serine/threonine protein kinase
MEDAPAGAEPDKGPAEAPTRTAPDTPPDPNVTRTGPSFGISPEDGVLPRLPDYEVLEEIGRGGGGIVFRARQWAADRTVALKFILGGVGSPVERQRFRAEVRALGRLNHPNVVIVHDVGDADGCPYFAMEYLPGGSLSKRAKEKPYAPGDAAVLVEILAHAVQAGHDAGILHRDLKPGNVLLTADGIPKIADFGLAKRWEDTPEGVTVDQMTRTREVIGTPAYMAPEQAAADHGLVGPATDVYGLGTILYELLTGGPPFKGNESQNTRWRVLHSPVVPPRDLNRRVPRALEAIALKCLDKDPDHRYLTARELADDLGRFRRGEPTVAPPLTFIGRMGRIARRHSRALGTVAAGAVLVAATVAIGAMLRHRNPPENPNAIVEQMEKGFENGVPQTLIGEKGRPPWSQWSGSEGSFATSVFHDETCCIQSATSAHLVLIRKVPDNGFKLSADISHESTLDTGNSSYVGLFFGSRSLPWSATEQVENWYSLTYNDWESALPRKEQEFFLRHYCQLIRTGFKLDPAYGQIGHLTFAPNKRGNLPIWRHVEITARPNGISAYFVDEFGRQFPIGGRLGTDEGLNKVGQFDTFTVLAKYVNEPTPPWPGWRPTGSVGLVVSRGQASFRNVVIEP